MATDAEELDKLPQALVALAEKLHPTVGEGSIFTEADYQMLMAAANDLEVHGGGRTAFVISKAIEWLKPEPALGEAGSDEAPVDPALTTALDALGDRLREFAKDEGYPQVMPVMTKAEAEKFVDDCAKIPTLSARHPFVRRLTGDDWAR